MVFPTVEAPGGGCLVGLMAGNALLRQVGQAAHATPDGMFTPGLQVVIVLAPITSYRLTLVGAQGVPSPTAEVQLGGKRPHKHK